MNHMKGWKPGLYSHCGNAWKWQSHTYAFQPWSDVTNEKTETFWMGNVHQLMVMFNSDSVQYGQNLNKVTGTYGNAFDVDAWLNETCEVEMHTVELH